MLALSATASAVVLIAESDLDLTKDRIGCEQSLQRALLGWKRVFASLFPERRRCAFHFLRCLAQVLSHFRDLLLTLINIAEPAAHAIEKLERVSAQLLLARSNRLVAVLAFLVRVLVAFTNQPVCGCDEIFLSARQRILFLIATLAATAATSLL